MFEPKYRITDKLLADIKRINNIVNKINDRRFPNSLNRGN